MPLRYFAGTFLVETILKWLGRFNLESEPSRNIECSSLVVSGKKIGKFGHSASRARHLALIITSVLHAFFFAMMGSRAGFPVMFVAYAVAAFARAVLTGKLFTLTVISMALNSCTLIAMIPAIL